MREVGERLVGVKGKVGGAEVQGSSGGAPGDARKTVASTRPKQASHSALVP